MGYLEVMELKSVVLRKIKKEDCLLISEAFELQNWEKPVSQYEQYHEMQESGKRDVIIAEVNSEFAGYLIINWNSEYPYFKEKGIPEIVDFNVLQKFQRCGIGTLLMDEAENRVKKISKYCGIGFGVTKDYGAAQILYIKRNYIPDGNGLVQDDHTLGYGDQITIDDNIAFFLIKEL